MPSGASIAEIADARGARKRCIPEPVLPRIDKRPVWREGGFAGGSGRGRDGLFATAVSHVGAMISGGKKTL